MKPINNSETGCQTSNFSPVKLIIPFRSRHIFSVHLHIKLSFNCSAIFLVLSNMCFGLSPIHYSFFTNPNHRELNALYVSIENVSADAKISCNFKLVPLDRKSPKIAAKFRPGLQLRETFIFKSRLHPSNLERRQN
ncbi:hypothetical protein TNCT_621671 [Trichonephila clavata]|uniref:Uncharacterized protein n=1 Tax=Trichonephila clavata TaxID=2740835 RepID=A0A8X6GGI5_TRICU|nr:hypothetical protein TNCT_621671 [Trichonephila clavata]